MKEMSEEEKALQAYEQTHGKLKKRPQNTILSNSDNVKYTIHSLDLMTMPPLDVRVCLAEDLQMRCVEYFEMCMRDNMKPSLAGFSLSLNVSRMTLIKYLNGETKIPKDNLVILQRFNGVLNALMEDYMLNGKVNPVSAIFIMKNNFGYKDAQEFVVNNQVAEETTPESLMEEADLLLSADPKKANIEE